VASHDLWLETEGLTLSADLRAAIDPEATLPDAIGLLRADSRVTLDPETGQIAGLDLRDWRLVWGGITVEITGTLRADDNGFAQGTATMTARGWSALIAVLTRAGAVPESTAPTATGMLDAMAQGAQTVEVPITFANGAMSVGFFPLGPAPRLR
jgi:hypothetical protein